MSPKLSSRNTIPSLCLACASSLPPKLSETGKVFQTRCCSRPICPSCIDRNPRLTRYDPCLSCLGGVGAVSARRYYDGSEAEQPSKNVDAAVRDEDVFILGDEDEDVAEDNDIPDGTPSNISSTASHGDAPSNDPANDSIRGSECDVQTSNGGGDDESSLTVEAATASSTPLSYYIQPTDTLLGIALKFKVDGRHLCRLNSLPPSTITTTPHLLHTRRILILPVSARIQGNKHLSQGTPTYSPQDKEREEKRAREIAEKRFQTLTKEVDWHVARAYVALADDPEESFEYDLKYKENVGGTANRCLMAGQSSLQARAVDRYLDDEEWEDREMTEGRGIAIPQFPLFEFASEKTTKPKTRSVGTQRLWNMLGR